MNENTLDIANKFKAMKKKSDARKRHLRDMNEKIKLFQAIADSAISDAARWHKEALYWKLKFEQVEKKNGSGSGN